MSVDKHVWLSTFLSCFGSDKVLLLFNLVLTCKFILCNPRYVLPLKCHLLSSSVNSLNILLMLNIVTPYSFPNFCCFVSMRRLCPLWLAFKIFEKLSLFSVEIPIVLKLFNSFVILFYIGGFCWYLLFSSSIINGKPFLFKLYFWYCNSFSLDLSFFHRPASHASVLLRSFPNFLLSLKIPLFQNGTIFFFVFDFFMPTVLLQFSLLLESYFYRVWCQ